MIGPGCFRLCLAIAVVISHLTDFEIGRPAVFAFFMLSGYWLWRMYEHKYRHKTVPYFYLSRGLRIWPAYAAACVGALIIHAMVGPKPDPNDFAALWLFGVATHGHDPVGISWSLDIELQFYLLVPLLWAFWHIVGKSWPLGYLIAVAGCLWALGWWLQLSFGIWTVFSYLPCFLLGIVAYVWQRPSRIAIWAGCSAFACLAAILWQFPQTQPFLLKSVDPVIPGDWFGMLWVVLLLPFLAWNVRQPSTGLDQHYGDFSYTLYLVHWPLVLMATQWYGPFGAGGKALLVLGIIGVAIGFYLLIDRPCARLRQTVLNAMAVKNKPTGIGI